MPTQRWTLTVVCVATAMLMLDIAVVNTALSDIASDLHTGLHGLQWIVDAYTTSNSYPNSRRVALSTATADSQSSGLPAGLEAPANVNYMRNSVKAVVDAFDGTVKLYAWDETDPILRTWEKVFPGTVQPRANISADLLSHLRYPEDLFKVQRDMLAAYHVLDAKSFYEGNDKWEVPEDPSSSIRKQPPYRLSVATKTSAEPNFSLTSVFVP